MVTKKGRSSRETLRSRAETILLKRQKSAPKVSAGDTQKLIHELEVHQIELEMQNDELQRKRAEIEEVRDRYLDLYDFAPVGYFTFDKKGKIVEVNLTGANLLGLPRTRLIGKPFTLFVEYDSIHSFLTHLMNVLSGQASHTAELRMKRRGKESVLYVSLQSMVVRSDDGKRCRSAVMDITKRKLAQEELLKAREELATANDRLRHLSSRLLTVQEEERRQIALEVHDGFTSSLSAIKYRFQDIPLELRKQYNLEELSNELEVAIGEARRIQTSLRPPALDDLGIAPALNWFCREFQKSHVHINIEKQFQLGEDKIPDSIKIAIYRITQEALNNSARHSKANSVTLSLTKKDGSIDLVIRDNGQGFNVESMLSNGNPKRGLGLSSMKERAALSGGSFVIQSVSGTGTIIHVSWPSA